MAYSESFSRYCTTAGPSYSCNVGSCTNLYKNYCPTSYSCSVSGCATNYYSESYDNYGCSNHTESCNDCTECNDYYTDDHGCATHTESGTYHYDSCKDKGYDNCSETCDDYYGYCNDYYNYKNNCSNYTNACQVTFSYTNYANVAAKYNTGQAQTLSWSQPALQVTSGVASISDPKEYLAVMTELKAKINTLCSSKGRNKVTANSTAIASGNSLASQYNGLRATLNSLYSDLKQTSTSAPTATVYKRTLGTDISGLRNQIDDLAKAVISYANYVDHSNTCYQGSTNSTYIDSIGYTNSSSSQRNSATNSGTAYARYLDYSVNTCTTTSNLKYS